MLAAVVCYVVILAKVTLRAGIVSALILAGLLAAVLVTSTAPRYGTFLHLTDFHFDSDNRTCNHW